MLITAVLVKSMTAPLCAQPASAGQDLARVTLEDLMKINVTSAARKSQRAEDVPAAVYVITKADIRRSGLTTLPELLRLVPGVQVAQVNANKWAVSIRGFNNLYSNKLLVLVDGRSVYSRTFGGVFWDMQDVVMSDIDRIEVIRGPGGAVWGANAVNGVINVITRSAADTQGLAANVRVGPFESERAGIRYGGTRGGVAYRVFSQWSGYGDAAQPAQTVFQDRWHSLTNGFRIDGSRGTDAVLAQGYVTMNQTRPGWFELPNLEPGVTPTTDGISHAREASVLSRWTRTRIDGTAIQVQAYYTDTHRDEGIVDFSERTSDVDGQYETRLGSRHGLMLGAGYRHVHVSSADTLTVQLGPRRADTFNTFLQDEIVVRKDLSLTLGSRLEHDTLGGWGLLPSARLMWEVSPTQRVWTAVSRARRTPSFTDRDVHINFGVLPGPGLPIVFGFRGNPAYASEKFTQAEAGYRMLLGSTASLEVTAFTGSYEGVGVAQPLAPTVEPTPAPVHLFAGQALVNLLDVRTSGAELNAHRTPVQSWQLVASYSFLDLSPHVDPAKLVAPVAANDGNAPRHQWQGPSTSAVRPGLQATASVFRVEALHVLNIPAYTRMDAGIDYRLNTHLTAAVAAQNLLNGQHQEFAGSAVFLASSMPRRARIDLRWQF